jgi:hypothetical protein
MNELSAWPPVPSEASGGHVGGPRLRWIPGLGGKVTSLRFGARGREWLAPPVRALTVPSPGQDWGELDCSGWDECFPNVGASADDGLADHGDVWRFAWTQEPGILSGSIAPAHRTYRFARDITAEDSALRIEYRLDNLGDRPLGWAWAQHMLLAADEQTRIVSSSPMDLRLDGAFRHGVPDETAFDDVLAKAATPTTEIELDNALGRAAKLWFEPPVPAIVAVVSGGDDGDDDGEDGDDGKDDGAEWLAWRIADSCFPHLGLWINLGGWGDRPLRHVAVEPAFGAHDQPADAYPELDPLAAGESRSWRVLIEAGSGRAALDALLLAASDDRRDNK